MTTLVRADEGQGDRNLADDRIRDMAWIPGGTFRMGSDAHYPEEAPSHRVAVDGFWIDRTPVTNRQFKQFVKATGHTSRPRRSCQILKTIPVSCRICFMPVL